jgi:hypothetical protein
MRFGIWFLLGPAVAACLGACRGDIAAPSLAPRPVERMPILDPVPASEPASEASPALAARLSAIQARADAAGGDFERARSVAATSVARAAGASAGDEAWIDAQQALSALEAARAPLQAQAAALDDLRNDPANAGPADREAIERASARIEAIASEQARALADLNARLR